MRFWISMFFLLGAAQNGSARVPLMAHFTTCAQLSPTLYPADTTTWFDAAVHPQVVFYAHMLFPLKPGQDSWVPEASPEAWHPPMVLRSDVTLSLDLEDEYYAEAQWLNPEGGVIAHFGLTMPARVSSDYLRLQGRQYIPHTFAMTLGTKDLRVEAGQKALPSQPGQYHIRFYVNQKIEGIAFFKMVGIAAAPAASLTPSAAPAVTKTPGDAGLNALRDVFRALTKTGK